MLFSSVSFVLLHVFYTPSILSLLPPSRLPSVFCCLICLELFLPSSFTHFLLLPTFLCPSSATRFPGVLFAVSPSFGPIHQFPFSPPAPLHMPSLLHFIFSSSHSPPPPFIETAFGFLFFQKAPYFSFCKAFSLFGRYVLFPKIDPNKKKNGINHLSCVGSYQRY